MLHRYTSFYLFFVLAYLFGVPMTYSQCPDFPTSSIDGAGSTLCEGASVTLSASGQNIPSGSFIDWYIGPNSTYDPYAGQGTLIGSVPIETTCNNSPEVLYIMVNPDNVQAGGPGDQCDEFIVLWTGSGGFNTSDIMITNLGPGSFFWDDFVTGNAGTFNCGTVLPPGPVPPNAILIIQSNTTNNIDVDITTLCNSGLPVYIIANNGTPSCTGGYFDNVAPCSSCPVMIDIGGSCPADIDIDYMPPASSVDGWGWSNMGSGVFADVVPPVDIPVFEPDETIIDDFEWTIPDDFCETNAGGNWFITGVLNPVPTVGCPDIFTEYLLVSISCPELILSGGGDVCLGNCPDNPTEINFEIIGGDVPFIADILLTVSIFPPFPIDDLPISDGQQILVCLGGGFLPSFDPTTGILTVPDLAIGITATMTFVTVTSASGCEVLPDPNFITITFIDAPTADAGSDVNVCAGEDAILNGDIGGTATTSVWSTTGDGDFADATDLSTTYTPGPQDILNGSVDLILSSMDPNGSCTPAESTVTITIDPAVMIDLGIDQIVCDNDVVTLTAMMTGGTVDGEWNTSGDGDFDDPFDPNTFYEPGPNDFNFGSVILNFEVTDPDACVGINESLTVTFVEAPQVAIPQDIEICEGEVAMIEISIEGAYTNVTWIMTVGDGQLDIISDTEVTYTHGPGDVMEGLAIISVTVESVFAECGQTTYNIPIIIEQCNCPDLETSPPSSALCATNDMLDLSTLFVEGGPGEWAISSTPGGSNPAMIVGNTFNTNSSDPGIYTVTYTLDNPQPGCPFSSSEQIVVADVINPDAGQDIVNCGPGATAIIGFPAPIIPVSVLWQTLGDGTFANASAQATIYTPGSLDSISPNVSLIYNVFDPICGNQADTMVVQFNGTPFALFLSDTFNICNETDKGSIVNFPSLIAGGDASGIWSNTGGAPVDFSNPSSVDFDGVAEGYYTFTYQTNSAIAPCQDASYIITISVEACLCPFISVQQFPGGVCNSQQDIELNAFVMAGAPGTWQILNAPPGSNPATILGSQLHVLDADQGDYLIRFTFNSAPIDGCPDSAEIKVFLQDQPTISISFDTTICGLEDVQLNANIGGSATNATWFSSGSGNFDDPLNLDPIYSPSINDMSLGQVRLISRTIDTFGFCPDDLDTMFLIIVSQPFTSWSSLKDTICNQSDSGSVVNLSSFIIDGDITGSWTDDDGAMVNLSNPANVDFDGVAPGTYHFTYMTQSAMLPCMDVSYTFQVLVNDCACPPLEISEIVDTICNPDIIDLDALIVNAAPGTWAMGMGPIGNWPIILGNMMITEDAEPGDYKLQYWLTDLVPGCNASKIIPFTLESTPVVNSLSFDCSSDFSLYTVVVTTNASLVTSDFGTIVQSGTDEFTIELIPAGQNINLELFSASVNCSLSAPVNAPNCECTLMIEDLVDTLFLCLGDTFTLIPEVTNATGIPFNTWIGDSFTLHQPSYPAFKEGTVIWSVKDSLCEKRDTFYVDIYESVQLEASFFAPFCPGGNDGMIVIRNITQGVEPYTVQLDNGQPFLVDVFPDTIHNVSVGVHTLFITDMLGCQVESLVTIPEAANGSLSLGPDVVILLGDSVLIAPKFIDIAVASYVWDPDHYGLGIQPGWIKPDSTVLLTLTVTDSAGCVYQDEMLIIITTAQYFFIPNVFSPNGDGLNDILQVETSSNPIDLQSIEIFDRWGNMVFEHMGSPPFSWDGTFKNKPAASGVYVIKMRWKDEDGDDQFYYSDLTLIR